MLNGSKIKSLVQLPIATELIVNWKEPQCAIWSEIDKNENLN